MKGTPFIYQGQELGMTNTHFASLDDFDDVAAKKRAVEMRRQGRDEADILAFLSRSGRDNSRTPMQWDDSANGGFSSVTPWYPANGIYREIHVARQREDSGSILNFYRALIRLRRQMPVFVEGYYQLLLPADPHIYAYSRTLNDNQALIICNFSPETQDVNGQQLTLEGWQLLLGNYHDEGELQRLRPYETRIYQR